MLFFTITFIKNDYFNQKRVTVVNNNRRISISPASQNETLKDKVEKITLVLVYECTGKIHVSHLRKFYVEQLIHRRSNTRKQPCNTLQVCFYVDFPKTQNHIGTITTGRWFRGSHRFPTDFPTRILFFS